MTEARNGVLTERQLSSNWRNIYMYTHEYIANFSNGPPLINDNLHFYCLRWHRKILSKKNILSTKNITKVGLWIDQFDLGPKYTCMRVCDIDLWMCSTGPGRLIWEENVGQIYMNDKFTLFEYKSNGWNYGWFDSSHKICSPRNKIIFFTQI